jgi:hypothetical protein
MKKLAGIFVILLFITLCACSAKQNTSSVAIVSQPSLSPTAWYLTTLNPTVATPSQALTPTGAVTTHPFDSTASPSPNQFNFGCGSADSILVSPNGEWAAVSCGYKIDQKMVVKNMRGVEWTFLLKDFLSEDTPEDITGSLLPMFWNPESKYLYFYTDLGYDGGGGDCFRWGGAYGLFRLNPETGDTKTILKPTNGFPGYLVRPSTSYHYLATDSDGVLLINLQTNERTRISTDWPQALYWSPDDKYLVFTVFNCSPSDCKFMTASAYFYDLETGELHTLIADDSYHLYLDDWVNPSSLWIRREGTENVLGTWSMKVFHLDELSGQ